MILKFIKIFSILLFILITVFIVGILIIDKNEIINKINEKIQTDFGKKITYDKDIKFSIFPLPQVKLKDIIYSDEMYNLDVEIKELDITSSWNSILKLKPEISNLHLNGIILKIKSNKDLAKNNLFLVNNQYNNQNKIERILKRFKKIFIKNGTILFNKNNTLHELNKFNGKLIIGSSYDFKFDFYYSNINSFYSSKIFGNIKNGLNFQVNQKFLNNNEINYSGKLSFDDEISFVGKIYSTQLNIDEVFTLLSKFKTFKQNYFYVSKSIKNQYFADFDVNIDNVTIQRKKFKNTKFQILFKNNKLLINELKSNYIKSNINVNGVYDFDEKKLNGNFKISDLLIGEGYFKKESNFKIKDSLLNCSFDFLYKNKKKKIDFENFSIQKGNCNSKKLSISGIDINNIIAKVDNLETFQDFFNLFNLRKNNGITTFNIFNLDFKVFKNNLSINDMSAKNNLIKIKSIGTYDFTNKQVDLKNNVKIKTKKFPSLPDFTIFIKGEADKYKTTYDLDKVKSALFKQGVDKLIGERKKIIINPKSLKKLLDNENIKELNTDKLFDLFLN